jgi:hypothetical protein
MTNISSEMVHVLASMDTKTLTKAQQLFQKRIREVDQKRQTLAAWEKSLATYHDTLTQVLIPLGRTYNVLKTAIILRFDSVYLDSIFSKTDKRKFEEIIGSMAADILATEETETVKALYNKYNNADYDAECLEEKAHFKGMISDFFGAELNPDINDDPEDWLRQIHARMAADPEAGEERADPAPKSAKALAKEAKDKAAEKQVSQSIRDVYRQLAKELHPDTEQDPVERDRKTLLMQQVNEAYQKRELLTLLELQLEIAQLDRDTLETMSDARLKHFNQILKDQCLELQNEIADREFFFREKFRMSPYQRLSPEYVRRRFQTEIDELETHVESLQRDLLAFKHTPNIKQWVKGYRLGDLGR